MLRAAQRSPYLAFGLQIVVSLLLAAELAPLLTAPLALPIAFSHLRSWKIFDGIQHYTALVVRSTQSEKLKLAENVASGAARELARAGWRECRSYSQRGRTATAAAGFFRGRRMLKRLSGNGKLR